VRQHGTDIRAPIFVLTGSVNHPSEIDDWIGPGKYQTLHCSKDVNIAQGILELLHFRVNLGFPTFFVKVRAHNNSHRGEPYNETADLIAYTRGLGWYMHCGAEVTESSTNKQHHHLHGDTRLRLFPSVELP
jgi:hypothetical protein